MIHSVLKNISPIQQRSVLWWKEMKYTDVDKYLIQFTKQSC